MPAVLARPNLCCLQVYLALQDAVGTMRGSWRCMWLSTVLGVHAAAACHEWQH